MITEVSPAVNSIFHSEKAVNFGPRQNIRTAFASMYYLTFLPYGACLTRDASDVLTSKFCILDVPVHLVATGSTQSDSRSKNKKCTNYFREGSNLRSCYQCIRLLNKSVFSNKGHCHNSELRTIALILFPT